MSNTRDSTPSSPRPERTTRASPRPIHAQPRHQAAVRTPPQSGAASSRSLLPSPQFNEPIQTSAPRWTDTGSRRPLPTQPLGRSNSSTDPSARSAQASPVGGDRASPPAQQDPPDNMPLGSSSNMQAGSDSNIQSQPLQPFFMLVEDTVTREHFHPTVHYIFADDDQELVTEAALQSLRGTGFDGRTSRNDEPQESSEESEAGQVPDRKGVKGKAREPSAREHCLVVDVKLYGEQSRARQQGIGLGLGEGGASRSAEEAQTADIEAHPGLAIASAHSMSADWQVTKATLDRAPTMGDGDEQGLMLRIEGRGYVDVSAGTGSQGGGGEQRAGESMEEMIERFERGLEDLRGLMDGGLDPAAPEAEKIV
jgi:hypothetical protein